MTQGLPLWCPCWSCKHRSRCSTHHPHTLKTTTSRIAGPWALPLLQSLHRSIGRGLVRHLHAYDRRPSFHLGKGHDSSSAEREQHKLLKNSIQKAQVFTTGALGTAGEGAYKPCLKSLQLCIPGNRFDPSQCWCVSEGAFCILLGDMLFMTGCTDPSRQADSRSTSCGASCGHCRLQNILSSFSLSPFEFISLSPFDLSKATVQILDYVRASLQGLCSSHKGLLKVVLQLLLEVLHMYGIERCMMRLSC